MNRIHTLTICLYLIFSMTARSQQLSSFYQIMIGGSADLKMTSGTDGSSTFVFGKFDNLHGQHFGKLIKLNAQGTPDPNFKKVYANGFIGQTIQQADNKIVVAGEFTTINSITSTQPVRLLSDGSVDPTFTSAVNHVDRFDVQSDGKIIVVSENKLKRLNADGTLDNSFVVSDFPYIKYHLKVGPGDRIFIATNRVMRLEPDGMEDPNYYISPGITGGEIMDMKVQADGSVFVSGSFNKYSTIGTPSVARILPDGHLDLSFMSAVAGLAQTIAVKANGNLLVGGSFYLDNASWNLVELSSTGSLLGKHAQCKHDLFAPGITQLLVRPNNTLLVAGVFKSINGAPAAGFVRLNLQYAVDTTFINVLLTRNVDEYYPPTFSLAPDNSVWVRNTYSPVLVFNELDSVRGEAVRVYPSGEVKHVTTALDALPYGLPVPFFQTDGKLFFPEQFVRLNDDGTKDESFAATGVFRNQQNPGIVNTATEMNGTLYVGGRFTSFNEIESFALVGLNMDGSLKQAFTNLPKTSQVKNIYALENNSILLAGFFPMPAGNRWLLKMNEDGSLDNAFDYSKTMETYDVDFDESGRVYVAGYDYSIGRWNIIRLLSNGVVDPSFQIVGAASELYSEVEVLEDGRVAIGGMFDQYQGVTSPGLILVDQEGNVQPDNVQLFAPGTRVNTVWERGDNLYVTGSLITKDLTRAIGLTRVIIIPPPPPQAPADLTAVYHSPGRSKLSWTDNATDEARFYVERAPGGSVVFERIDTLAPNTTTLLDTVLINTDYVYRVGSVNDGGTSYSNTATFSWRPAPEGSIVLTAERSQSEAVLQWQTNLRYSNGYCIQRGVWTSGTINFVSIDTVASTVVTYTETMPLPLKSVVYRVVAFNTNGSINSNQIVFMIPSGSILLTVNQNEFDAELHWQSNVEHSKGFIIQRGLTASQNVNFVAIDTVSTSATTYVDAMPRPLKSHVYRIVAFNTQGVIYSNEASVTVAALDDERGVTIFPNPAQNYLTISGLNENYDMLTSTGKIIQTNSVTNGNTITIDTSKLAEGIYFIRYREERNVKTRRIVVSH